MKKNILCALVLAAAILCGCDRGGYVQLSGYAQGGTWSVKYNSDGIKASPDEIHSKIKAILEDIDTTLSGYNKRSQLSRLNAGESIRPSEMLCEIYDYCHSLYLVTGGAVDASAGPVFDIWGFGFKNDSLPSADQVHTAMAASGMGRLVSEMRQALSPDGTLTAKQLLLDGTGPAPRLNFNAVAQGYSADTVARFLSGLGVYDMLVDIGEIYCRGLNPSGGPWRVGVDMPSDGNNVPGAELNGIWESNALRDGDTPDCGQGIVTSGNYRKFYIKNGKKYSHTIDPRTGYPVEGNLLSATIVAPSSEEADALATYCMVIGLYAAREFILGRDGIEGYLIYDQASPQGGTVPGQDEKKSGMAEWRSPGFNLSK